MKNENVFQANLVRKLRAQDWVVDVVKNDAGYTQGFPDLTVFLANGKWALLECKKDEHAPLRPNQAFYISKMGDAGFARLIYPQNELEVIDELYKYASGADR